MLGDNPITKTVVIYVGRFQPFHKGHNGTYQHLIKKFGKDNVFIGTSNKTDNLKSPFNFKEKVKIMTTMFGIPSSKIHQVKNPYQPTEILKKFDEGTTAFITVVGEKDKARLGGKYFQPYKGEPTEGYRDRGYVYASPSSGGGISGTEVRNGLSNGSAEQKQNFFTDKAFPKFNKTIFKLITDKLNEGIFISKEQIEEWLINESSAIFGQGDIDDGPNIFFPNYEVFKSINAKRAAKIGYEIVNMITTKELEDYYEHPDYPNGPVKAVTFFPAGVIGATTANNQVDIYSSGAYSKWFKHATRKASLVGYSLVMTKQAKSQLTQDKTQSGDEAHGDKELKDEFENSLQEVIKLPVEIGDTLLMGKFKNKKVVVKTIGEDEHGLPTINGKKVVTFRYGPTKPNVFDHYIVELAGTVSKCEKCNHQWEIEVDDSAKYLCHSCGWNSQKQEYDFDAFDSWQEKMGLNEMPMSDLQKIDTFADKQLNPVDTVLTGQHFFDRLNDPRNGKEISNAELIGFFKRLGKKKKDFLNFLNQYNQIVVKDNRTNLNIPFMKQANKLIAKTIMRKDDFKSSDAKYTIESHELDEKGGLTPAQKLRRKSSLAGKQSQIAWKRKRTMTRRKPYSTLIKIAYKLAYRQVYEEFRLHLFPDTPKSELSIIQKSQIHKNVLRKKKRVLKRAKFRFLPALRQAEVEKFQGKNENLIKENIESILSNKYNVKLDIYEYPDILELHRIVVPKEQRGNGVGSNIMKDLIKYADSNNKTLFTTPSSDFGGSKTRLVQFYKSFGFKNNKGSNRDFRSKESMIRLSEKLQGKNENMDSIDQLISDIDNKIVEMFLPNTKTPQQLIKENINESKLLQEGGAYGHMSHPFDTDINLTFGQLKDIVNRALEGTLEFTREKTDGQALAISWRDGRLVAARNKGHLKNKGENALDIKAVADKFAGRGELEKAYNFAMKDLSDSIKSLSEKQRDKVFKQGACFMNLEVIYPTSVNVIPYGQALLVFHGTMEFNMDGIAIGENGDAARVLAGMIKQVNKDVQDNYTIQGPPVMKLPKSQNLSASRSKYSSQISKLQKEFGLKDTDGVADYHQAWWSQWVDKNSPSTLDNKTKMGLVKRWAFYDNGFRLDKKNLTDEKVQEWAIKIDKQDQVKISKTNVMKFEEIFLGLGAEVLEFTSSALTVNPDAAVRDIKKRIDTTIKDVKKSGDPKKIEKLKLELMRLQSIGGSKKIVPNEGIVFVYNGSTFKLTGTFASVNQILGIFF